eukprot:849442-Rhodomonas_salina.3
MCSTARTGLSSARFSAASISMAFVAADAHTQPQIQQTPGAAFRATRTLHIAHCTLSHILHIAHCTLHIAHCTIANCTIAN